MKIIVMVDNQSAQCINDMGVEQWVRSQSKDLGSALMLMTQEDDGQTAVWTADGIQPAGHGYTAGADSLEAIRQGGLCMYPKHRRVTVDGVDVKLKNKEFELLLYLILHAEHVFSREHLYECIWGGVAGGNAATVTVHINRIRQRIEKDPAKPRYVQTVWGSGYRFSCAG